MSFSTSFFLLSSQFKINLALVLTILLVNIFALFWKWYINLLMLFIWSLFESLCAVISLFFAFLHELFVVHGKAQPNWSTNSCNWKRASWWKLTRCCPMKKEEKLKFGIRLQLIKRGFGFLTNCCQCEGRGVFQSPKTQRTRWSKESSTRSSAFPHILPLECFHSFFGRT